MSWKHIETFWFQILSQYEVFLDSGLVWSQMWAVYHGYASHTILESKKCSYWLSIWNHNISILLLLIVLLFRDCLYYSYNYNCSFKKNNDYDTYSLCIYIYCIRIRTRGGIYGKIWPKHEGNPEGSGLILRYIPTWVLNRTLSHS